VRNDGRIHDRALADEQPALGEQAVDLQEQRLGKLLAFQQPTKAQDRGLAGADVAVGGDPRKSCASRSSHTALPRRPGRTGCTTAAGNRCAAFCPAQSAGGLRLCLPSGSVARSTHTDALTARRDPSARETARDAISCPCQSSRSSTASSVSSSVSSSSSLLKRTSRSYVDEEITLCRDSLVRHPGERQGPEP
jgi:hypothetical protein